MLNICNGTENTIPAPRIVMGESDSENNNKFVFAYVNKQKSTSASFAYYCYYYLLTDWLDGWLVG